MYVVVAAAALIVGVVVGRKWSEPGDLTLAQTAAKAAQAKNSGMRR